MIDTDKYEGHLMDKAVEDNSQVWCWSKWWSLKNDKNIEQMSATAALLIDAPKLLAEVKRLRYHLDLMIEKFGEAYLIETLIERGEEE